MLVLLSIGITTNAPAGTGWSSIIGGLTQINVSPVTNEVWGVNSNNQVYYRDGITNDNKKGKLQFFLLNKKLYVRHIYRKP